MLRLLKEFMSWVVMSLGVYELGSIDDSSFAIITSY